MTLSESFCPEHDCIFLCSEWKRRYQKFPLLVQMNLLLRKFEGNFLPCSLNKSGAICCDVILLLHMAFLGMFLQVLKKIAKYIQEQNEKVYAPLGLLLTDPIERGLRVVSFPNGAHRVPKQHSTSLYSISSIGAALHLACRCCMLCSQRGPRATVHTDRHRGAVCERDAGERLRGQTKKCGPLAQSEHVHFRTLRQWGNGALT